MSTAYKEYLKTLEMVKKRLYKKIFRASLEKGLLDNLEEKPVGIIANDLEDDRFGHKMNNWLNKLSKVQLLSSSEPLPLSYKMSKKITMLYMAEEGNERVSFDTGIYTGINDVFLDDTMSLDELLGNEKLKNKYIEANRKYTKTKSSKEQVVEYDDYEVYTQKVEKERTLLRQIKELAENEIAV